jgi:hypothetical protein
VIAQAITALWAEHQGAINPQRARHGVSAHLEQSPPEKRQELLVWLEVGPLPARAITRHELTQLWADTRPGPVGYWPASTSHQRGS